MRLLQGDYPRSISDSKPTLPSAANTGLAIVATDVSSALAQQHQAAPINRVEIKRNMMENS
ncbi:hypothetical protein CGZ80_05925 [Rhodopirellula sp. MGV]|nr:hypothetical protein CGZ80_05925 [Rhodopirellula sp. MGV]PNY34144.1 hypothetical protein C2E31_24930 [Rhodopirellula baltica]